MRLLEEYNISVPSTILTTGIKNPTIKSEDLDYLISLGADIYVRGDKNGNRDMFMIHMDKPENIRVLLSYGLNPNRVVERNNGKGPGRARFSSFRDFLNKNDKAEREILDILDEPIERKYPQSYNVSSPSRETQEKLNICIKDLGKCETDKHDIQLQLILMSHDISNLSEEISRVKGESINDKERINRLNAIKLDLEGKIVLLNIAVENGTLGRKRLIEEIDILKNEIRILRGFTETRGREEEEEDAPNVFQREDSVQRGYECVEPYRKSNATRKSRVDSCVPVEGGIFDNIRTEEGGRFTNKQKCIEVCHID